MSNIEPTEEQKQAALSWTAKNHFVVHEDALARLLAEREAKLRKQLTFMEAGSLADYNAFAEALQKEDAYLAEINLINERLAEMREVDGRKSRMLYDRDVVIDTLRARAVELEADRNRMAALAIDNARDTAKLQERIDHLEGERDLVHVDIYEHLLHKAPNMGVALHIDGTAQELVGDVIAWVDKAAEVLAGRDVVSLQTFRRVEEERDAATKRAEEQEAKLKRAIDIIVSEELDRDFGEPPTPRNLEVRALLTECGYTKGHAYTEADAKRWVAEGVLP